jgi:hypothetical protein
VFRSLTGSLVLAAVLGFATAAPAPKGAEEPTLYFPTRVGAQWVYLWDTKRKEDKDKDPAVVEVVTAVEDKEGAKVVTVGRVHTDGKVCPTQKWAVSDRGLFQTANLIGQPVRAPVCFLKLPHKRDQTWTLDAPGDNKPTMTASGPERVKVPAGEYDAIRVEQRDQHPDPQTTRWYAPGVGLVKVTSGDLLIVLKSFDPGKE